MNGNRYKIGVLGGMGPLASAYFYEEVIRHTKAKKDQDHIDLIILSHSTLDDRNEVLGHGDKKNLLESIKKDLEIFEAAGVEYIAMTCNTAHIFLDDMQAMTDIKILHMPRLTAERISKIEGIKKVGILGTNGTISQRLYHNELENLGLIPIAPDDEFQKLIMEVIFQDVKGKGILPIDKLVKCVRHLEGKGADTVILGCTELSLMKNFYEIKHTCVDALDTLTRKVIHLSDKEYIPTKYDYSILGFLRKVVRIIKLKIKLLRKN